MMTLNFVSWFWRS